MVMQNSIPKNETGKVRTRLSTTLIVWVYIDHFPLVLRSITTKEAQVLALRHSTLFGGLIHAQDLSSRGSNSPSLKTVPFSVTSSPAHLDDGDEPLASLRIGIIVHDTVFAGRVNNIATLLEANRQVRFVLDLNLNMRINRDKVSVADELHSANRSGQPSSY